VKNISRLLISFLITIFISFQTIDAQVSRNPDPGRPVSRIPRPDNEGNISDRNRNKAEEGTKERKDYPEQINNPINTNPVNTNPVEQPIYPHKSPVRPHPPKTPENIPIEETTIIEYHTEIIPVESPDKYIDNNPLAEIEENESSIIRYNEALSNNPKDTLIYFLRGNAKLVTGDNYGAIEDFTIYLKLVPWDKEAYYKRGLAFLYYGDQNNALIDFQIASELGYKKGDSIIKKYN